jgi:hypothetical protein
MSPPFRSGGAGPDGSRRRFVGGFARGLMVLPWMGRTLGGAPAGEADEEAVWFPARAEWARAGCRDGREERNPGSEEIVSPAGDLQAAMDRVAARGGGRVRLGPGDYELRAPLLLRSHVVLQGAGPGRTRLLLLLRGAFPGKTLDARGFSTWTTGLLAAGERRAFVEDLSIVFDPSLPPPPTLRTEREAFVNDPGGRTDLYVVGLRFSGCEDCCVRRVQIINAGSHPLMIEASRHLTVETVTIDGSHNKGGLGNGYVNLTRSTHVLLTGLHVRDVRHLSIQNSDARYPCRYNVLVRSQLEVDVNFHNGDSGHNLVQDCRIAVPTWHWWGPFAVGVPGQHQPPGPGNLVYRCDATRVYPDPKRNRREAILPDRVYRIRDHFEKSVPLVGDFAPAPKAGTLVPVGAG